MPRLLLALVLAAAALLRFVGLDRDVRRGSPTPDEWVNFVGPVAEMWQARSLDPHVHGGYPGLFNWVVLLPMGLAERAEVDPGRAPRRGDRNEHARGGIPDGPATEENDRGGIEIGIAFDAVRTNDSQHGPRRHHLEALDFKVHRGRVMQKMHADSVADLVRMVEKLHLA